MRQAIVELLELMTPKELTGTADVDITAADYTAPVSIMTIVPKAGGTLINVELDLDFNKATTGWDKVSTANDVLDCAIYMKIDGTNYRRVLSMSQMTALGDGTHASASIRFHLGDIGVGADCDVRVTIDTERADIEIPYRITYRGLRAPTVTPVVAG